MKKFKRIAAISLLAVLFIGTFAYLYKKSRPQPERYEEVIPELSDISRNTVVTGKIVPRDEISIKPQISGIPLLFGLIVGLTHLIIFLGAHQILFEQGLLAFQVCRQPSPSCCPEP